MSEAIQPSTVNTTASAPAFDPQGGSTTKIHIGLGRSNLGVPAEVPSTDPTFKAALVENFKIAGIQDKIDGLQEERDSVYRIQAQVTTLGPNLEANTVLKPEIKRKLMGEITSLTSSVEEGIAIDNNFTKLKEQSAELENEHLALTRFHFNPSKYPLNITKKSKGETAKIIDELTKQTDRLTRSFTSVIQKIGRIYTATRDALPGTGPLNLKPLKELTAAPTDVHQRKTQRLGGGE